MHRHTHKYYILLKKNHFLPKWICFNHWHTFQPTHCQILDQLKKHFLLFVYLETAHEYKSPKGMSEKILEITGSIFFSTKLIRNSFPEYLPVSTRVWKEPAVTFTNLSPSRGSKKQTRGPYVVFHCSHEKPFLTTNMLEQGFTYTAHTWLKKNHYTKWTFCANIVLYWPSGSEEKDSKFVCVFSQL